MLKRFGKDEFDAHVDSGRIVWREDPITKGIYQYQDTNDIQTVKTVGRQKERTLGQQWDKEEEDDESKGFQAFFESLFDKGMGRNMFLADNPLWNMDTGNGKGSGVGKGEPKGRAEVKGAGKGNKGNPKEKKDPILAIEDMPEEQQRGACTEKTRKLQLMLMKFSNELEQHEAVQVLDQSSGPRLYREAESDRPAVEEMQERTVGEGLFVTSDNNTIIVDFPHQSN
jgi:hypothetical protein